MKTLILIVTLTVTLLTAGQLSWAGVAPDPDNYKAAIQTQFGPQITDLKPGENLDITATDGTKVGTVVKDADGKISISISINNTNVTNPPPNAEVKGETPKPKLKATIRRHRTPRPARASTKPASKPVAESTKPAASKPPTAAPPQKENEMTELIYGLPMWAWIIIAIVAAILLNRWFSRPAAPVVVTPTTPVPHGPGAGTAAYRGSGTSTPLGLDLSMGEEVALDPQELIDAGYECTIYTTPTSHYRRFKPGKPVEKMPDPRPGYAYAEVRIPPIELGVVCRERHDGGPARMTVDEVERLMVHRTDRTPTRDREGGADRSRDEGRGRGDGARGGDGHDGGRTGARDGARGGDGDGARDGAAAGRRGGGDGAPGARGREATGRDAAVETPPARGGGRGRVSPD